MTRDTDWPSIPLKALFRRRDETGRPDLPLLSVYRDLGIVLREGREDNYNRPGSDLAAYRIVRPGDLVLNKMKTWQGSLGVSEYLGIVSPAYFVCELVGSAEPRFLHHLLRSQPLIAEYAARSKGIRPSQWDLP
jgi:type I restriction enzyme, S subunit